MTYELKLERYQGPLDKLLELIEARKLEITEISLAEVTDDFLKYLSDLQQSGDKEAEIDMRLLADFIVIASRLLFIKSKALIPDITLSDEEESDIRDLEERLQVLKDFKPAISLLAAEWRKNNHAWSRPYFLNSVAPQSRDQVQIFYPSAGITKEVLEGAVNGIFAMFQKFTMEHQTIKEHVISLEAKIKEVIARVREIAETSFSKLSGSASRSEIIIAFLAILHLAREQMVKLEQEEHLSDIIIKPQSGISDEKHDGEAQPSIGNSTNG